MDKLLQKYYTRIPRKYKKEVVLVLTGDNLQRLLLTTVILAAVESLLLLFFSGRTLNTEPIILLLVYLNIFFLPVFFIMKKRLHAGNIALVKIIQYLYLSLSFLMFLALSLIPQQQFVTIDTYVMALFATAALLYLHPLEGGLLYLLAFTVFFVALPHYQAAPDIVLILRINAAIMSLFAWVIGRIVYRMKLVSLADQLVIEHKNEQLKEIARRDSMTSLLNHETAYCRLRDETDLARLTKTPLSLVMLDIDNFKDINDLYGHRMGDQVIVGVAGIIVENCRAADITARYGGEEFLLVMPGTAIDKAGLIAERIRVLVEATAFQSAIHVTVSAGVCQFSGESTEELINKADQFLYKAKHGGKNRVESPALLCGVAPGD